MRDYETLAAKSIAFPAGWSSPIAGTAQLTPGFDAYALIDLGRAPTFYDCLVEVEAHATAATLA